LARIAFLLTGDYHLAEDLVQQTLRVAGRWTGVIAAGDPDAYVRRVLYTQHVSWWRRARRTATVRADPPDRVVPDPSGDVVLAVAVQRALARLTPKQRAVLVLRCGEDLTEVQAAEILGCRVGTVKSQVRAGRPGSGRTPAG
jgi:RNA polymerase sigma-70 factor (sigma-E family)